MTTATTARIGLVYGLLGTNQPWSNEDYGANLEAIDQAVADLQDAVPTTLPVANGGTGSTTAAGARTNLSVYSKAEVDASIDGRASDAELTALAGTVAGKANTAHTHAAADVVSGILDVARIPDLPGSKITGNMDLGIATFKSVNAQVTGSLTVADIYSTNTYGNTVAGHGGFRTVSVALDGYMGGLTSSRRFKQDIGDALLSREVLRSLRVVFFRYIADVESAGAAAAVHLGLIAEEVHDLGLTWLVDYEDGVPYALNDRFIPFVALLLAQDAEDRIDALERRLALAGI